MLTPKTHPFSLRVPRAWPLLAFLALSGCANLNPGRAGLTVPRPEVALEPVVAPSWQSPLPHGGSKVALSQWWARFNDPLLVALIEQAQALSPDLAAASERMSAADAARVSAGSALTPSAGLQVLGQRGAQAGGAPSNLLQAGVQASWELDLFGKNQAGVDASTAQLQGAQAAWHEARVSVAAEVARTYLAFRLCGQQLEVLQAERQSREQTLALSDASAKAGFLAPASLALAQASVAQAQSGVNAQQLACTGLRNALTVLSGRPPSENTSNRQIASDFKGFDATNMLAIPGIEVPSLPAALLRQRPDVYRAEREVLAASAQVSQADAVQKPSISLGGTLGLSRLGGGAFTQNGPTWTLGPVSLTMPLLASNALKANASAARVALHASEVRLRATLRQALRETDDAMATIASVGQRAGLNRAAALGYKTHLMAAQARQRAGLASLLELEEARRVSLAADASVLALEQERVGAWISLYRAAGGGWSAAANANTNDSATPAK